jgi:hypothetical protein
MKAKRGKVHAYFTKTKEKKKNLENHTIWVSRLWLSKVPFSSTGSVTEIASTSNIF